MVQMGADRNVMPLPHERRRAITQAIVGAAIGVAFVVFLLLRLAGIL